MNGLSQNHPHIHADTATSTYTSLHQTKPRIHYAKKMCLTVLLASSILLAGCGKKDIQNISFDDAYQTLTSRLEKLQPEKPDMAKPLHDMTSADFSITSSGGVQATGTITASGMYAPTTQEALVQLKLLASIHEPQSQGIIIGSGDIDIVNKVRETYLRINTLGTAAGNDQAQNIMPMLLGFNTIIASLRNNWIALHEIEGGASGLDTTNNLSAYGSNLQGLGYNLVHALRTYPIFVAAEKTSIDGKPAYKLGWNPQGVSGFIDHLLNSSKNAGMQVVFSGDTITTIVNNIIQSPLDGYLIIHAKNDIELRIESLTTKDAGVISLTCGTKRPVTWRIRETIASASNLIEGKATIVGQGIQIDNSRPPTNTQLTITYTPRDKKIAIIGTTPQARATITITSHSQSVDSFVFPTITGATPLSQITKGLSLIGGGNTSTPDESSSTGNSLP